jgi:hypothetical protein
MTHHLPHLATVVAVEGHDGAKPITPDSRHTKGGRST